MNVNSYRELAALVRRARFPYVQRETVCISLVQAQDQIRLQLKLTLASDARSLNARLAPASSINELLVLIRASRFIECDRFSPSQRANRRLRKGYASKEGDVGVLEAGRRSRVAKELDVA